MIGWIVHEIFAFLGATKVLTQHKIAFFEHFECNYFVNGMSNIITPTHFLKVLNEDFPIKKTVFKNIQVEKNDVISNMADFAIFWPKNANIS